MVYRSWQWSYQRFCGVPALRRVRRHEGLRSVQVIGATIACLALMLLEVEFDPGWSLRSGSTLSGAGHQYAKL